MDCDFNKVGTDKTVFLENEKMKIEIFLFNFYALINIFNCWNEVYSVINKKNCFPFRVWSNRSYKIRKFSYQCSENFQKRFGCCFY